MKACCAYVLSFGNLLYKAKRKYHNFNAIPKNFPGTASSESFSQSVFAESLSGREEEKLLLWKICVISVRKLCVANTITSCEIYHQ